MSTICKPALPSARKRDRSLRAIPVASPGESQEPAIFGAAGSETSTASNPEEPSATKARIREAATSRASPGVSKMLLKTGAFGSVTSITARPLSAAAIKALFPDRATANPPPRWTWESVSGSGDRTGPGSGSRQGKRSKPASPDLDVVGLRPERRAEKISWPLSWPAAGLTAEREQAMADTASRTSFDRGMFVLRPAPKS